MVAAAVALLFAGAAQAQAPAWGGAAYAGNSTASSYSCTQAATTDANGNVFVTGFFAGTVAFGATVLTSAGGVDLFVAKYVPATSSWAWAQSGGGAGTDAGYGIAVNGASVYVVGNIYNSTSDNAAVTLGGTSPASSTRRVAGASPTPSADVLLAKYIDNGGSATLRWTQVGGGTGGDGGSGVATSGNNVYVVGTFSNNKANANAVIFGGDGLVSGTYQVRGASAATSYDVLLTKYIDNGTTGSYTWSQVGGGVDSDYGGGVAVNGTSVYLTGSITNSTSDTNAVVFGGNGTTAGTNSQYGAKAPETQDLLVVKYTDSGSAGSYVWSQVGGGSGPDNGQGIAVSGSSVYVTGGLYNSTTDANAVVFGGSGITPGYRSQYGASATASEDVLLAKYTDNGRTSSYVWSQVGGGTDVDYGYAVAASGGSLYVTGTIINSASNDKAVVFGGSGTVTGTSPRPGATSASSIDLVVAKYTDGGPAGTFQWSQVGGGTQADNSHGVAVSGQQVYVPACVVPTAIFGPTIIPAASTSSVAVLAYFTDTTLTPLAALNANRLGRVGLTLYPNPAPGCATLSGAAPGVLVQALDALGRVAATATASADGIATLVLPAGLYVVKAGSQAARLVVE